MSVLPSTGKAITNNEIEIRKNMDQNRLSRMFLI